MCLTREIRWVAVVGLPEILVSCLQREQFGAAWWIYIDGAAYGTHVEDSAAVHDTVGYSWLPGLFTTIAFVM